jgi:diguanylate cyclase (GGDEF)-like protein
VSDESTPTIEPQDQDAAVLIESLRELDRRLEALSPQNVTMLLDRRTHSLLVRRAQDQVRSWESALLDSLPAQIAVLDRAGVIIAVNNSWRLATDRHDLRDPCYGVGSDYLAICDAVQGTGASEARCLSEGIRAVLAGTAGSYAIEYACTRPEAVHWYLLNVIPIASGEFPGAIVMHLDVTERREAQRRIAYLSRVHAMQSGVNSLMVRVRSRDALLQEACRIAVEAGGFLLARIDILDRNTKRLRHAGLACRDEAFRPSIERMLAADGGIPSPILAQAIAEKLPVVANHSENDPRIGLLGRHAELGIRSKAAIPILLGAEVFGVMAFYANECDFFHAEEIRLLAQLGDDISYALDHIEKERQLELYAYYDALTGLANRTLFLDRTEQFLRAASSTNHLLAVAVIDLERFKIVNDSLGRSVGDDLLRQVADWLAFLMGDRSRLARVDGDHFALVFPDVKDEEEVAVRLDRFMTAFLDHPFQLTAEADFRVIARGGVALFPADGTTAETLYRNAEAALRKAKAVGDRYLFYTPRMSEAGASRLALESQLRQALERHEFVLHYQPKIRLVDGDLTGAEALIRWQDPRSGLVPPGAFIPLLEETGLICEVGYWALSQAVEDYLRWSQAGLAAVPVAVNVSAVQLRDPHFVEQIRALLSAHPGAAAGLALEITESVIMEDVNYGIAHLQAIRDLGISIAIDDFGTGFSSLSYLSRLPVDALKIDRSFVADLAYGSKGAALVSSIIHLAHSLKLKVIAEGVETEAQLELLRLLGCDEMQGFLHSAALPGAVFEQRLAAAGVDSTPLN